MSSVISVSELTSAIRSCLEPQFRAVFVRGEISNFKAQSSGHLYFSLKDAGSQVPCALFRGSAAQLARMPKDGDQVIAKGDLSVYEPRGNYQLIIRELQFLGMGELLLKLHQLKEMLSLRGWFDPARKKPIPKMPSRIGVITSPTGAAVQDILNILGRRFAGISIILNPVKVQGEGSAQEIAQAIAEMNRYKLADVLIVGRGGGSIEDLWAFNEEVVAKAIFESEIPVISAVGHETDFTIADFVADVRAPTPSAAAELAIAERANLVSAVVRSSAQTNHLMLQAIRERRQKLRALFMHPLLSQPHLLFVQPSLRLDDYKQDLDSALKKNLENRRVRLEALRRQLEILKPSQQILHFRQRTNAYGQRLRETLVTLQRTLKMKRDLLDQRSSTFSSLHPRNLIKKGFSLLFSEKGDSLILSAEELSSSSSFIAVLADGRIRATVLGKTTDGPII